MLILLISFVLRCIEQIYSGLSRLDRYDLTTHSYMFRQIKAPYNVTHR